MLTPKASVVVGERVMEGRMASLDIDTIRLYDIRPGFELLEFGLGSVESKFSKMARMTFPRHVCGGFRLRKVWKKKLRKTDIKERSRLYVNKAFAPTICPGAFAGPSNESRPTFRKDLTFYDPNFNLLSMVFHRRETRSYLKGGWGEFVAARDLTAEKNIEVDECICNEGTGERFFIIGSIRLFGALIG